jgi:hypothetical protein
MRRVLSMMTAKFFKSALSGLSALCCISETHAVKIDPYSYCLTCKEGCAGAAKEQCERMCPEIKEQVASLQMSRLTNETGKKFRTLRNKVEKADMLHESPLYKCLGITRESVKAKKSSSEKNKAALTALQNVEDALDATLNELQDAKKALTNSPGEPSGATHPTTITHHEVPHPSHHPQQK